LLYTLIKRLAQAIPVALAVTVFCFLLVHLAPGEPLDAILPPDASAELVQRLKADYGMDQPLPVQYAKWLGQVVSGNLGTSIATGRSVASELRVAVHNTLVLAATAALLGVALGVLFGAIAGAYHGSWVDRATTGLAIVGVSVPHYWLGMVLVIVFSVQLGALPAVGAGPSGGAEWSLAWDNLKHMILPAVTLAVVPIGVITRSVRAAVIDIMAKEFVAGLRGKGLRRGRLLLHVAKNVTPAALPVIGLQLGYLLGGSILVEAVFSWPGTGLLLHGAIFQRDIPVLQSTTLVLALFFVLLNVAVDIVQSMIDPRIRR